MEIVKSIDWHPKWNGGAPIPQVYSNGQKIFLIYTIADWDVDSIQSATKLSSENEFNQLLALIEFNGHTFRFGIANDEVFPGLPLYKHGLNKWAHFIENSLWIEELKQIHKVHPYYNPFRWTKLNHYVFLFKDDILEVIASDYKIEVFETSYQKLGSIILDRMNK